jgi:hypothetical protein
MYSSMGGGKDPTPPERSLPKSWKRKFEIWWQFWQNIWNLFSFLCVCVCLSMRVCVRVSTILCFSL